MHPTHINLLKLVKIERQVLTKILAHLKIINDQKIFTQMGHASLLDYCVKELGYSESAAYRRISALRLERKLPAVAKHIESGALNLSVACKLNQLIDQKEKETRKPLGAEIKNNLLQEILFQPAKKSEDIVRQKLELPTKNKKIVIEVSEENYKRWIEFKGKYIAKRSTDEALLMFAIVKASEEKSVRSYVRKAAPQKSALSAPLFSDTNFNKNRGV